MSQKILFKDGLRIAKKELQLLQSLGIENLASLAQALSEELPAVITANGTLDTELKVTADGTNAVVATGSALLANGTFISLDSAVTLAVASNASGLKVVLKAGTSPYAAGTISLSNAADRFTLTYVPGAGNSLTAAEIYAGNEYVRLQNGASDLGTFRIESVSSNTITLAEPVSGATTLSGLLHAPAGKFFPGYPLTGVSTDLISYDKAEVRFEASSYVAAEDEILLASVSRSTSVTVSDLRVPYRSRGVANIVNDMVAENASIAESKLALSAALLKAKALSPYLEFSEGKLFTTQPDFYVKRSGQLRKVITEDEAKDPVFSGLSVTPASSSIGAGETLALTASVANQVSGSTVTYTFTSLNTTSATVTQAVQGSANATVTGVTSGTVQILVTASAEAYGGAVAAYETRTITVTVGAGNGVLTSATVNPLTLTLSSTLTSNFPTLTASVVSPVGSPSVTYTWAYVGNASSLFTISGTSGASITVQPKAVGAGQITMIASAPASGSYAATTLAPITVNIEVAEGLILKAEPAFRVTFTKVADTTYADFRWGVNGTATVSGLTATVTLGSDDAGVTFSQNALEGQAFYDVNRRRYLILTNTVPAAGVMTLTLKKILTSDPNPGAGVCYIRSLASRYTTEIYGTGGSSALLVPAAQINDPLINEQRVTFGAATKSTMYKYRLTAYNPALAPASVTNDINAPWGEGSALSLSVPASDWIVATSTTSSVIFRWSMLKTASPNPYLVDSMETEVQWKIGDQSWSGWHSIRDDIAGMTEFSYTVSAPSSTVVQFQVRVVDLAGNTVNNPGTGYNGTASATTLALPTGGFDTEYVYPFTLSSSTPWTQVGGRYLLVLSRDNAIDTTFTTLVSVSRIDTYFDTTLSMAGGDAVVKPIVYPSGNIANQIAGDLVVEGDTVKRTLNINQVLDANPNTTITVALEYAGTGNPNTLDPTGGGKVVVWYRGTPGQDQ